MKLTEKMSYLQGMLDGLDIDTSTKEGKLLVQMTEVMHEMVMCVDDSQTQVTSLQSFAISLILIWEKWKRIFTTQMIVIAAIEDDYDDFGFVSDELYEVCCPNCGETVILDESMIEEGSIDCPECGLNLEFDYFDDTEVSDLSDDSNEE